MSNNINFDMSLEGIAYLKRVSHRQNNIVAEMAVINNDPESKDDIWLSCILTDRAINQFIRLNEQLKTTQHIKVHFLARYLTMESYQPCLTTEDPENIIFIRSKLLWFDEVNS